MIGPTQEREETIMQFDLDPNIKRRPDGSIDTGFYMARGRVARAHQARDLTKAIFVGARQKSARPGILSLLRSLILWRRQAS
jgi:hypothetical protein